MDTRQTRTYEILAARFRPFKRGLALDLDVREIDDTDDDYDPDDDDARDDVDD